MQKNTKYIGILTTGRLGFTDTAKCVMEQSRALGCDLLWKNDLSWEKAMSDLIDQALAIFDGPYLLFYDGDSLFAKEDVDRLLGYIESDPEMHAVFPLQAGRSWDKPLAYNYGSFGGYDYSTELTRVRHGHFGCSLIRREVFETMPKPWFFRTVDDEGGFDKHRGAVDPDTFFWNRFVAMGRNVYQANRVCIGHLELCALWQTPEGVSSQTIHDYWKMRLSGRTHPEGIGCPLNDPKEVEAGNRASPNPQTVEAFDGARAKTEIVNSSNGFPDKE